MGIVALLLVSLWWIAVTSPRQIDGTIHWLLAAALVLLILRMSDAVRDWRRELRRPRMRFP